MKRIFYIAAMATLMACSGKTENATPADDQKVDSTATVEKKEATPTAEDPSQVEADVLARVKAIYDHAAKAYANDGSEGTDTNLDELYCSKDWNATVRAVYEKDMATDGMGFFEADYWVMGQDVDDYRADGFKVERIFSSLDPEVGEPKEVNPIDRAGVVFNLHNCGTTKEVRIELVKENGKWMIDDMTDVEVNLDWKQSMKEYPNDQ